MKNVNRDISIVIFVISFYAFVFVGVLQLRNHFEIIDDNYNTTESYFINTIGCKIPEFNVIGKNSRKYIKTIKTFQCDKPLTRTLHEGAFIVPNVNETELQHLYKVKDFDHLLCNYTEIVRKNDKENEYGKVIPFKLQPNVTVKVKPGIEFIKVDCQNRNGYLVYEDYHFFVIEKLNNEAKLAPSKLIKRSDEKQTKNAELSVMLLGIDTLSHLQFLRQLNESAHFIKSKLQHSEYWGFNKIADNTYPNLIPVFSGLDVDEIDAECLSKNIASHFDNCSFIWKPYKEAGYKTAFGEDVASLALFNFINTGFLKQPTDYYLRPIMLEMERNVAYSSWKNVNLCMGGRCTADVVLEYAEKFIPLMRHERFFSFFWTVSLTHDDFNLPKILDKKLLHLLESYENAGIFNNTIVFLFSDHGLRFGSFRHTYQGMMEERLPLFMVLYPAWMKSAYPTAIANLNSNAKRLTTPFDLHATLQDLHNLRNLQDKEIALRTSILAKSKVLPRGISLFLPIPTTRTCQTAHIASHWCCCYQRSKLRTDDVRVQRAALYIVKLINEVIEPHQQCYPLYLSTITKAYLAEANEDISRYVKSDYFIDITVQLQTKPNLGSYEATVRISQYRATLTGTISRTNLYGNESYCIDDVKLKLFCYCL